MAQTTVAIVWARILSNRLFEGGGDGGEGVGVVVRVCMQWWWLVVR